MIKLVNSIITVKKYSSVFPLIPPKIRLIEPILRREIVMLQLNNLKRFTIYKWKYSNILNFFLNKFSENIGNLIIY